MSNIGDKSVKIPKLDLPNTAIRLRRHTELQKKSYDSLQDSDGEDDNQNRSAKLYPIRDIESKDNNVDFSSKIRIEGNDTKKITNDSGYGKTNRHLPFPASTKTDDDITENDAFLTAKSNSIDEKIKEGQKWRTQEFHKDFTYIKIFRFATFRELCATWLGILLAIMTSLGLPTSTIIYGEVTQLMVERVVPGGGISSTVGIKLFGGGRYVFNATQELSADLLVEDANAFGLASLTIGLLQIVMATISVVLLSWSARHQVARIRVLFLKSILRQDMEWYDTQTDLNFASKMSEDLNKLSDGMGERIGMFFYLTSAFVFNIVMSFGYGWKLTLVVFVSAPITIITTAIVAKFQSSLTAKELISYGHAGSAAEEVLSSVRTVVAFGGEEKEIKRYAERLEPANKAAVGRGVVTGFGGGMSWFTLFLTIALVFWYGVGLILSDKELPMEDRTNTPKILIIVLWGIVTATQHLVLCSPHTEAFSGARAAAPMIFNIIRRTPVIDSLSESGETPEKTAGNIKLTDVSFAYPSRPNVQVLTGLNLEIKAGETVALVGSSGCGKSTVLQLVQRLYDPAEGSVQLDGKNLKSLNVAWLRSQLGVVGQEPVLFSGTIQDNIARGRPGSSQGDIEEAAIAANCHDFIKKLPNGYATTIGACGAQLSGGQKQRIAIARSLLRNPKLLLLDEATSALDVLGERRVQEALDKASRGRTTIMVTHRLATVTNADRIVFIHLGRVAEQGTHEELMQLKGHYFKLVQADSERSTPNGADITEEEEGQNDEDPQHHEIETRPSPAVKSPESIRRMSGSSLPNNIRRFSSSSAVSFDKSHRTTLDKEDNVEETLEPVSSWALWKLNSPEWPYILFGSICSLVVGGFLPLFALLFSEVFALLSLPDADLIRTRTTSFCKMFVLLGIICGSGTVLQSYLLTKAGVKLTQRLRVMTFANFLKQEMGWFDDNRNSVGALCLRLSADAAAVQGATGMRVGILLQGISTLLIGVLMSSVFSLKLTLVALVAVPVVLGGISCEGRVIEASHAKERKAIEGASNIATEAIMNIRTVHSLGLESQFLERYEKELIASYASSLARSWLRGFVFSLGISTMAMGFGLTLFYGGRMMAYEGLPYRNIILVSEAVIFGSSVLGQVLANAPNFSSAKLCGDNIVRLLNRVPLIKSSNDIVDDSSWQADGTVKYSKVEFHYPTRKNVRILQGLDLEVLAGKTVALVGHSGCGKSTVVQLLQRLYEPTSGSIMLDGKSVLTGLTLPRLRSQLGLVSQEPTLFDKTIAENISYGDNSREITIEEIIRVAKMTNIHEFITSLPLGYDTPLGAKGAQLSGGQKQRVAIARALVRNPRLLLLDEATSALDTESEKLVQRALDVAKEGRTCIMIAHRLSTVQNADVICVIDKGRVAESGTHEELLAKRGLYADLQKMQTLAS